MYLVMVHEAPCCASMGDWKHSFTVLLCIDGNVVCNWCVVGDPEPSTAVTEDGVVDSEEIHVNITDEEKEQLLALGEYTMLNVELKRSMFGLWAF